MANVNKHRLFFFFVLFSAATLVQGPDLSISIASSLSHSIIS